MLHRIATWNAARLRFGIERLERFYEAALISTVQVYASDPCRCAIRPVDAEPQRDEPATVRRRDRYEVLGISSNALVNRLEQMQYAGLADQLGAERSRFLVGYRFRDTAVPRVYQ